MRDKRLVEDNDAGRKLQKRCPLLATSFSSLLLFASPCSPVGACPYRPDPVPDLGRLIANGGVVIDDDVKGEKDGNESDEEEMTGIKLAVPNTVRASAPPPPRAPLGTPPFQHFCPVHCSQSRSHSSTKMGCVVKFHHSGRDVPCCDMPPRAALCAQLQKQLLDECELICTAGKLQPLPRDPTARDIISQFIASKAPLDTVESKLWASHHPAAVSPPLHIFPLPPLAAPRTLPLFLRPHPTP